MFLFGRYTGLVTGTSELDPLRWPGSKWKCLVVRILYRALSIYLFFFFFFEGQDQSINYSKSPKMFLASCVHKL